MENEFVNPKAAIPSEEQDAPASVPAEADNQTAGNEGVGNEGQPEAAIPEGGPGDGADAEAPEFDLEVKFNKKMRRLNREEAVDYAEKGLYFDTVKPIYNKLDYIAAQRGISVEELVEGIYTADEQRHRDELIEKFGEDSGVIDDLMKVYREGQKQKYEKIKSDREAAERQQEETERQSLETRLAAEFAEVKAEFPEIKDFASLPKSVKTEAAEGRDLLSAYLRYRHKEQTKIAAAASAESQAAKASTGSGGTGSDTEESVVSAFLSGIARS